jgi:F0F1-type ATP synthase alpha subunit
MTPENILTNIIAARKMISTQIISAADLTNQITDIREQYKRVEDVVVNEIWNNPSFKNDKARNEQKHLARVNDGRLVSITENIRQAEGLKAATHGNILELQNQLTILTLQFEFALLGKRIGAVEYVQRIDITPFADTIEHTTLKGAVGVSAITDELEVGSLRSTLKQAISPERQAALTTLDEAQQNYEAVMHAEREKEKLIDEKPLVKKGDEVYLKPTDTETKANTEKLPGTNVRF